MTRKITRTRGDREQVEDMLLMIHALLTRFNQRELGEKLNLASGYQVIWRWRDRRVTPSHLIRPAILELYQAKFGAKEPTDVLPKSVVDKIRRGEVVELDELKLD